MRAILKRAEEAQGRGGEEVGKDLRMMAERRRGGAEVGKDLRMIAEEGRGGVEFGKDLRMYQGTGVDLAPGKIGKWKRRRFEIP